MRRAKAMILLAGAGVVAAAAFAQDTGMEFMPPGGRTLLLELLGGEDAPPLAEAAALDRDAEAWRAWAEERAPDMGEPALSTLAGYAALNLPLPAERLAALDEGGDAAALPPDGKDLAISQCQFCHSLFSGYLMHDRDKVGWLGTFKSPFHTEIPMNQVERETFANYSALNMPLDYDDVPPELRF